MSNDNLKEFSLSDAYVNFDEKGVAEGIYRGYIEEPDPFTPGDMRIAYKLEQKDGKIKALTSKSKRLARQILEADPQDGDLIKIQRSGTGFKTNFIVTNLSGVEATPVAPTPPPDEVKPDDVPF